MSIAAIVLLALAMSTDAFAAAIGKGSALHRPHFMEAVRTGAIFGTIEALTPILGWLMGVAAAPYVKAIDHWIAFAVLALLGVRMVFGGLQSAEADRPADKPARHSFWLLAATGLGTSIDALAVGVGLAFVDASIVPIALAIGATTFVMVTAGVMLGRVLGAVAGQRAEIVGGIILIGIGTAILVEHLGGRA